MESEEDKVFLSENSGSFVDSYAGEETMAANKKFDFKWVGFYV